MNNTAKAELEGAKILIKGTSYYSTLNHKNTKGKYPSNCYEVGILEPNFSTPVAYDGETTAKIFANVIDDMIKDCDDGKYIKIANSIYKIPVYMKDAKTIIENPNIKNGTNIMAKCIVKYNAKFEKYFLIVKAVKVLDDYIDYNPFDDIVEFEEF